ncbi:uncharacterized protein [Paramisgurnus dabryanus]|uniref:uncharacterized protein n=1 Tax=Paramisgurnus dabryanus TaxID=90735 RepID=UPI003CCF62B8
MATRKKMTVTEVLSLLENIDDAESDGGAESDVSWSLDSSSDTDSESDSEIIPVRKKRRVDTSNPTTVISSATLVQNPELSAVPAEPSTRAPSPPLDDEAILLNPPSADIQTAKDGTVWTVIQCSENRGRLQSQNVMTEAAGPTPYAKRNIEDDLTAFLCLVEDGMLKHIRDCTIAEAHRVEEDSSWDITVDELKGFIALIYIRGAQGGKGMDLASFWSADWGYAFFKETMSRNRFQEIMRFLRFDKKETRRTRLQENKFALVAEVWEKFQHHLLQTRHRYNC